MINSSFHYLTHNSCFDFWPHVLPQPGCEGVSKTGVKLGFQGGSGVMSLGPQATC